MAATVSVPVGLRQALRAYTATVELLDGSVVRMNPYDTGIGMCDGSILLEDGNQAHWTAIKRVLIHGWLPIWTA
jgi:hypothetical protein